MKIFLSVVIFFISLSSFSQKQLLIKGIHPNFYLVHDVVPGETYAIIAKRYNLTALKLATYNKLSLHDGKIFAKTINVPLTSSNFIQKKITTSNDVLVPVDYVLNSNESVTHVSVKYKISTQALVDINNLTNQQLYSRGQLTVGYLKVNPSVASFFNLQVQQVARQPQIKPAQQLKKPEPTGAREQKMVNGVRVARSRTDPPAIENNPPVMIITDTVPSAVVKPTEALPTQTNVVVSPRSNRLKVFVDCSNTGCDYTFIKTEINIVDFLLDRVASDVHMLITSQRNGSGGRQYQMIFYGQNNYKNQKDTLRFNLDPNATESEGRDLMLKYIKLGLTPFIAKTDYARELNIQMKRNELDKSAPSNANTKDKWNYWVFTAGLSSNISQDAVYTQTSLYNNISANRVTDKLKVNFSTRLVKNISKITYQDTSGTVTEITNNSSYNFQHSIVKSIGENWGIGYEANASNAVFSNNKNRLYFKAAIEYAIFPYKEVNNKYFTINYGIDLRKNKYYDTTLYDKLEEVLVGHDLSANLSFNQKWGSFGSTLSYSNYFHDWNLNNLGFSVNFDVRVTGGLSVSGYFYGELVGNQIYLPRKAFNPVDLFTRRRQVASNYNYFTSLGVSYRFGSKLNNFVNPRFNN